MIFPSWLQSASSCRQQQAHFKKKCHHSCCTAIGWESKMFECFVNLEAWQVTDDGFFVCEMDFAKTCYQPKPSSSLHSFFQSSIGFLLKIRPRSKSTYSKLNPVQSSRSKLRTCPRIGCLPGFWWNTGSTASSDGCAKKLAIDLCHDSESIALKFCIRKKNWMKIDAWKPCRDLCRLD